MGVGLMAQLPTGTCKPFLVTRPMPVPPSIIKWFSVLNEARAYTLMPLVTSGSSPESLITAQDTTSSLRSTSQILKVSITPAGVESCTSLSSCPDTNMVAAARAAAAAHEPVV